MRRRIVAGNWKLHGSRAFATSLVGQIAGAAPVPGVELVVLPPLPYLGDLIEDFEGTPLAFGAQDVSSNEQGAYTGEVSGSMLVDVLVPQHYTLRFTDGQAGTPLHRAATPALRAALQAMDRRHQQGLEPDPRLAQAVADAAKARGAASVYWLTAEDNYAGRMLYDRVAARTPFIKYQRDLG